MEHNSTYSRIIYFILIGLWAGCLAEKTDTVSINFEYSDDAGAYAHHLLTRRLEENGYRIDKSSTSTIHIVSEPGHLEHGLNDLADGDFSEIEDGGYRLKKAGRNIFVLANSSAGMLYGVMDLAEQLEEVEYISEIREVDVDPAVPFRAIKFNLPWSPYRPGPATELHTEVCRDLSFWESFLDMMAANRFNALTLWNTHPFPYMIRAKNYPKATPFNDDELAGWNVFWQDLFKMAKSRAIETYIVNWNIVVSPEFAKAYGANVHFDRSELVKKYTRESVTQTINEYPDLTGIGVTLADWMGNWGEVKMSPREREDWIQDTFVEGMKAADRKVKFIHRAVLAGDPKEMRRVIDYAELPDKSIVEIKFNWSHGYSTPKLSITHANDAGTIMTDFWQPKPENYFIAWMIRNEDFFVLPWGDPDFIRQHIKTNLHPYVQGYFIGSEGHIPAVDYSTISFEGKDWKYAFEKQGVLYHLWGKLLYNPEASDQYLADFIKKKYPNADPLKILNAYASASKIPQYIASFYKGTWDFTLYSEGFLAPWQNGFEDGKSEFISLEELIRHETLDRSYVSIQEFCTDKTTKNWIDQNMTTPPQLANAIHEHCSGLNILISALRSATSDAALHWVLDDLETWNQLGFYFAEKIRAGVAFQDFVLCHKEDDRQDALGHLEKCIAHWKKIIGLTESRYRPMPYVSMGHHEQKWPSFTTFHWKNYLRDVESDFEFVRQYNHSLQNQD